MVGQICCHGIVRAMHMRRAVKIVDMLSGVDRILTCDRRTNRRANGQVYRLIYTNMQQKDRRAFSCIK